MPKSIKIATFLGLMSLVMFTMVLYAAIELNYFLGSWSGNQVTIKWETGTELDHAAFHVWRSTENLLIDSSFQIDTSQAVRLTNEFILNPDENPCSQQGHKYEFVDNTVDENEDAYYYYLESFNCSDGKSEFQGNLRRIGGLEISNLSLTRLYLPIAAQ